MLDAEMGGGARVIYTFQDVFSKNFLLINITNMSARQVLSLFQTRKRGSG